MDGAQSEFDLPAGNAPKVAEALPLIVDSFAGGGGASTGIERALGRSPDVAINHSAAALALHAVNHPETLHLNTSVYKVDPRDVVKPGQRVGLAWFSPDCKHFSKAKGGQPLNKNIRDLAWIVVHWAELVKPEVILLENVEEFITWGPLRQRHEGGRASTAGPLDAEAWEAAPPEIKGTPVTNKDGTPYMEVDPLRKGQTFNEWVIALRKQGYKVQWRELRACDYGAPTIRKRLFVVARRDGKPIVWPEPTHGAPTSAEVKAGKLKPWRTAAECIDWSVPCPSIFDTKEEIKQKHGLTAVRPLADKTLARVARGLKRYVLDAERPFIVNLTHGARTEDLDAPLRTVTGANRGEKALVSPSISRFNSGATGQDMREPLSTVTANSWIKKPGGAAPLGMIAPHLMTMRNAGKPFNGANEPSHTITAGGAGLSLVAPVITYAQHGGAVRDIGDPHHTICANQKDVNGIIAPILASIAHGDSGGRREYPLTDPYGVVTSGGITHAVSVPYLLSLKGSTRRDSKAQGPHPTVLAGGCHSALVAPALVQTGYGERDGQAPRSLDLGEPLGTVVASGAKHAPVAAFLAQHNTGVIGHDPSAPMSTVASTGSHQNPVAAWFAKYYGTGDGARSDDPCHTITVRERFSHMQASLSAPPFEPCHEERAREVADFLRAQGAWDGGEFVTLEIEGETFVIVDIGMRMLTPRELFRAQGFPEDYVIEGRWQESETGDWSFVPFTKNVQVSCCGNSVCPDVAEALVTANCPDLVVQDREVAA